MLLDFEAKLFCTFPQSNSEMPQYCVHFWSSVSKRSVWPNGRPLALYGVLTRTARVCWFHTAWISFSYLLWYLVATYTFCIFLSYSPTSIKITMPPWDLQLQKPIAVDSEYRVLERDLKCSIASTLYEVLCQTFRPWRRTLFYGFLTESTQTVLSTWQGLQILSLSQSHGWN